MTGWRPARLYALLLLALLAMLAAAGAAMAMTEPKRTFPALTGRVVDDAGIIPPDTKARIETKLKELEAKSGIQLVVATVKSLSGGDIETYANELFRFWKLGEVKADNGALLVVALDDRKVRVEAGYGLEGTLTDAASSLIIANDIVPRFKAKDYGGGIESGVDRIVATLSADAGEWAKRPSAPRRHEDSSWVATVLPLLFYGGIFLLVIIAQSRGGGGGRRGGMIFVPMPGSSSNWGSDSGGFSGGGGDSGGFSGGGGSSGGGGASGSW